jgi:hypothetical protein
MLVGRPRPERCMQSDLRFLCARGDRWCPAPRRGPGVSDGVRTQCGPGRPRSRPAPVPYGARPPAALGPPRAVTDRSAVSGWPFLLWEGLGGAGHWSALAASRPGLRKVRLCEGGSWLSRRLACSVRCRQSQETHEFYAASASVLDMPRVWGFLAVVSSLACRQGGTLRLRKAFTSCQEVTYRSCCEASTSVATAACSARHEPCTPGKSTTL